MIEFNFYLVGVKGSILVFYVDVNFYNGYVDGNLIVVLLFIFEVYLINEIGEIYFVFIG